MSSEYKRCANSEPGVTAPTALAGVGLNIACGRLQFGLISVASGSNGSLKETRGTFLEALDL